MLGGCFALYQTGRHSDILVHMVPLVLFLGVGSQLAIGAGTGSFSGTWYPVLERAGCRQCHNPDGAASATRLRFPETDAPSRRIEAFGKSLVELVDRKNPGESLLLKKPTNRLPHTGSQRIKPGTPEEAALISWVRTFAVLSGDEIAQALRYKSEEAGGGGQATHMPLKVNSGGVIPVIFASSMLAFPQTLMALQWVKSSAWLSGILGSIRHGEPLDYVLFVAGIMFFCFFYVSIIFNPNEAADSMRRYGWFIAGIRPGRNTAEYINQVLTRITIAGGLYLAILCLIPDVMISRIHLQHLPVIGNWVDRVAPRFLLEGLNVRFAFGGTSLLIVVGVAMDTISQIEAQLVMRHYEGFTPRSGRIRCRRSALQ
jgi:hypothetical protein